MGAPYSLERFQLPPKPSQNRTSSFPTYGSSCFILEQAFEMDTTYE